RLTYLAIAAEFFGGVGLIVGFLSRIAAFGIAITMVVAMVTDHLKYGFFINWFGDKQGHHEYHLLAVALAAIVIADGAGAFSWDRALYRRMTSPDNMLLSLIQSFRFLGSP
ncbi:MAG TPA: DoxX family protein, partial [Candidatus Binatia bacterium]